MPRSREKTPAGWGSQKKVFFLFCVTATCMAFFLFFLKKLKNAFLLSRLANMPITYFPFPFFSITPKRLSRMHFPSPPPISSSFSPGNCGKLQHDDDPKHVIPLFPPPCAIKAIWKFSYSSSSSRWEMRLPLLSYNAWCCDRTSGNWDQLPLVPEMKIFLRAKILRLTALSHLLVFVNSAFLLWSSSHVFPFLRLHNNGVFFPFSSHLWKRKNTFSEVGRESLLIFISFSLCPEPTPVSSIRGDDDAASASVFAQVKKIKYSPFLRVNKHSWKERMEYVQSNHNKKLSIKH